MFGISVLKQVLTFYSFIFGVDFIWWSFSFIWLYLLAFLGEVHYRACLMHFWFGGKSWVGVVAVK